MGVLLTPGTAAVAACLGEDPTLMPTSAADAATTGDASIHRESGGGDLIDGAGGSRLDAPWVPCTSADFACEDFDHTVAASWLIDQQGDGGTFAITASATAPSLPNTNELTVPPDARVWLTFRGALQGGGVDCSFAMKVVSAPPIEALFAQLSVRSSGNSFTEITLHSNSVSTSTYLADAAPGGSSSKAFVLPPLDQWFRVTISTRLTGHTLLSIDDEPPVIEVTNTATESAAMAVLSLGASVYGGTAPPWRVSLDNILCVRAP